MARSTRPYQVLPPDPKGPKMLPPEQVAAMSPEEQDQMRRRAAQWRAENDLRHRNNQGVPLVAREPGAALRGAGAGLMDGVVGSFTPTGVGEAIRGAGQVAGAVSSGLGTAAHKARVGMASSPEEAALIQARREAALGQRAQAKDAERAGFASELAALTGQTPQPGAATTAASVAGPTTPDLPDTINDLRGVTTQWQNMRRMLRDPALTTEQKRDIQFRMDELANQGRDLRSTMPRERGVPSPSLLSPERIANARNIADFDTTDFGTPENAARFRAGLDENETRFQQERRRELAQSPVAARNDLARLTLAGGEAEARDRRVAQATAETRAAAQRAEQMQSARDAAELRTLQSAGTTPGVAGSTLDAAVAGASAIAEAMSGAKLAKIPAEAAGQFNVQVRQLASAADQLALLAPDERRQAALDLMTSLGTDAATLAAKLQSGKIDDQSRALYEQALEVVSRITEMAG